jgi:lysophospholipase L1-like esterase
MAVDRLSSADGKPNLIEKVGSWLLIIPSALLGIVLLEVFCWLFVQSVGANIPGRDRRVVFFDGRSPIFQNHGDIFTYLPNNDIRNVTAFFNKDAYVVEYDYRFRTNNLGLTQESDVLPRRKSLLLLGDSFTEGQGAEPWFQFVAPTIDKLGYQPVNGGVMGTGFGQWLKLTQYLASKDIDVRKLVVLFISDDYRRDVWSIQPPVFQCVSGSPLCRVENSYLYRLPPPGEMSSWIDRVRTARGPMRPQLKLSLAALMPATYSGYIYVKQLLRFSRAEEEAHAAIAEMVSMYGPKNIAFIHLPQKDEIEVGPDSPGLRARRAIEEAGGKLFDGFKLCGLKSADYYTNDNHPNKSGYTKIAACASDVINELVSEGQ